MPKSLQKSHACSLEALPESELLYRFQTPLVRAKFLKRYKRFFADCVFDNGTTVVAHCANTGSMKTAIWDGADVYLSQSHDPKRKLPWTLELVALGSGMIGVNTAIPNRVVLEALRRGSFASFLPGASIEPPDLRGEVKWNAQTRFDASFRDGDKTVFIEIKNVSMQLDDRAVFPDAITERGLKHLHELMACVDRGHRAVMIYVINRPDGRCFSPSDQIDPAYADGLRRAHKHGVEVIAVRMRHGINGLSIGESVPVEL